MFYRRFPLALTIAAVMGCAGTTIDAPLLTDATMSAHKGDYRAFVDQWMGALQRKSFGSTFPTMPSDARLLPLGKFTPTNDQVTVLQATFSRWCELSAGDARLRDVDMVSPGRGMVVCEARAGAVPIAAMQVFPDANAAKQGRRELLVQHWYPPDIARFAAAAKARAERMDAQLAGMAEARRAEDAREQAALAARVAEQRARDQAELERLAKAAEKQPVPQCRRFERESNALRARFMGTVEQAELRRYVSDLIVAFDECLNARPAPPPDLTEVYHFNLQSFQLFGAAWDANLLQCDGRGTCRPGARQEAPGNLAELARLQRGYSALTLSPPASAEEVLARVRRFALER